MFKEMMGPESITSQWYYNYVVARMEQLQHAQPNTLEADELERLTTLLEEYETRVAALQQPLHQMQRTP